MATPPATEGQRDELLLPVGGGKSPIILKIDNILKSNEEERQLPSGFSRGSVSKEGCISLSPGG
ncbi:hypothetical protein EYF80_029812 [Liparis tanakae]|uniref:Uncharacterized protein n=1 Tax=Liparis tanakae TaxID=230148 RepID=A0A4Z2H3C0_9TELE|nr:hypothetical protein EYF80_029812 [Liparis tanakae]